MRNSTIAAVTLIEQRDYVGEYGMRGVVAILDHPAHGRLYLHTGYGGESGLRGGAIRWEHGIACRLLPTDTLAALDAAHNDTVSIQAAMLVGHRDDRPIMDWDGVVVAAIARQAGLD